LRALAITDMKLDGQFSFVAHRGKVTSGVNRRPGVPLAAMIDPSHPGERQDIREWVQSVLKEELSGAESNEEVNDLVNDLLDEAFDEDNDRDEDEEEADDFDDDEDADDD